MNAVLTVRQRCRTVRVAREASNPHQCAMCGINPHSLRHAREGKTVCSKYRNVSHVTRDPAHAAHGALAPIKAARAFFTYPHMPHRRDRARARRFFSTHSSEKKRDALESGALSLSTAGGGAFRGLSGRLDSDERGTCNVHTPGAHQDEKGLHSIKTPGGHQDEKGTNSIGTPGGHQDVLTVNESGLYVLILTSRNPNARRDANPLASSAVSSSRS